MSRLGVTALVLAVAARAAAADGPRVTTVALDAELPSVGRLGGVAADARGNLFVANFRGSVWRIDATGHVERLPVDLQGSSGNAVDASGNLYQASFLDGRIVRVTPAGDVETWVSEGLEGPVGIAPARDGSLYVCNCRGNSIVRVTPDRRVEILAGGGDLDCPNGIALDTDGRPIVVNFKNGHVLALGPDGTLTRIVTLPGTNAHVAVTADAVYVTQAAGNLVYRIDRQGHAEPFAGTGTAGTADGPALEATLAVPNGIAVSADGTALFVNNLVGPRLADQPTTIVIRRIGLGANGPSRP